MDPKNFSKSDENLIQDFVNSQFKNQSNLQNLQIQSNITQPNNLNQIKINTPERGVNEHIENKQSEQDSQKDFLGNKRKVTDPQEAKVENESRKGVSEKNEENDGNFDILESSELGVSERNKNKLNQKFDLKSSRKSNRMRKDKKDLFTYLNCHQCKKIEISTNMLICTSDYCKEAFCMTCLKKYHPRGEVNNEIIRNKIEELKYDWICYLCNEMCLCKICTGRVPEKERVDSLAEGKKKTRQNNQQEEEKKQNIVKIDEYLILEESGEDLNEELNKKELSLINNLKKDNLNQNEGNYVKKSDDLTKKKEKIGKKLCLICNKENINSHEIFTFKTLEEFLNQTRNELNRIVSDKETNDELMKNKESFNDYYMNYKKHYKNDYVFKSVKLICKSCFNSHLNLKNGFSIIFNILHSGNYSILLDEQPKKDILKEEKPKLISPQIELPNIINNKPQNAPIAINQTNIEPNIQNLINSNANYNNISSNLQPNCAQNQNHPIFATQTVNNQRSNIPSISPPKKVELKKEILEVKEFGNTNNVIQKEKKIENIPQKDVKDKDYSKIMELIGNLKNSPKTQTRNLNNQTNINVQNQINHSITPQNQNQNQDNVQPNLGHNIFGSLMGNNNQFSNLMGINNFQNALNNMNTGNNQQAQNPILNNMQNQGNNKHTLIKILENLISEKSNTNSQINQMQGLLQNSNPNNLGINQTPPTNANDPNSIMNLISGLNPNQNSSNQNNLMQNLLPNQNQQNIKSEPNQSLGAITNNIGKLVEIVSQFNQKHLNQNSSMLSNINNLVNTVTNLVPQGSGNELNARNNNANREVEQSSLKENSEDRRENANDMNFDQSKSNLSNYMFNVLDELKKQIYSIQYYSLVQKLFISYIFKNLDIFIEQLSTNQNLNNIVTGNLIKNQNPSSALIGQSLNGEMSNISDELNYFKRLAENLNIFQNPNQTQGPKNLDDINHLLSNTMNNQDNLMNAGNTAMNPMNQLNSLNMLNNLQNQFSNQNMVNPIGNLSNIFTGQNFGNFAQNPQFSSQQHINPSQREIIPNQPQQNIQSVFKNSMQNLNKLIGLKNENPQESNKNPIPNINNLPSSQMNNLNQLNPQTNNSLLEQFIKSIKPSGNFPQTQQNNPNQNQNIIVPINIETNSTNIIQSPPQNLYNNNPQNLNPNNNQTNKNHNQIQNQNQIQEENTNQFMNGLNGFNQNHNNQMAQFSNQAIMNFLCGLNNQSNSRNHQN